MRRDDKPGGVMPLGDLPALNVGQVNNLRDLARNIEAASHAFKQILKARARVTAAREKAEAVEVRLLLIRNAKRQLANKEGDSSLRRGGARGTSPEISDEAILQLALKAVVRFAPLPEAEAERAWSLWEVEIRQRLPKLTAEEVCLRARELRSLNR